MLAEVQAELSKMDDEELHDHVRRLELLRRRQEAELAASIGEAERRRIDRHDGHTSIRNWLRAELDWSGRRVILARRLATLVDTVPGAGDALHDGHIGIDQADELARARANPRCGEQLTDPDGAADVLLEHCEQRSFDDARVCIRRWETLADLDGAHRERASSVERRRAFVGEHDGSVVIEAAGGSSLDAAEMRVIFDAFVEDEFRDDVADRSDRFGPDAPTSLLPRTAPQRCFDALHKIFRAAAANATMAPARSMTLNLLSDELTFRGAMARHGIGEVPSDDELGARRVEPPCETDDGMVLVPDDLVAAAIDGHVRRVIVDGAGTVTDLGRRRRLFTGAMREAVKLMARRCEAPGCTVRGRFAQVDHLAEWGDDGETSAQNGSVQCGHHNRLKHRRRWRASRTPEGTINWYRSDGSEIAPVGRRHVPDDDEIEAAIRRRMDELVANRQASS